MMAQDRLLVALAAALAFGMAATDTAPAQDVRDRELAVIPAGGETRYLPPSPPRPGTYRLGINVQNTPTGVLVVGVAPGSVAQTTGIEAGDTLVTVGGYQVGYVGDRLFDVGDELARRVDAAGGVTVLVRDGRTGTLENAGVRFGAASRGVSGRLLGPSGTRLPA
ncbi:MAG: PDZ domain-containing protein [Planctomycetota bacterium]